jgi:shikimate dehydrogenase
MSKKKFSIIGKPLNHSLSPILHEYWFKKYNIEAEYSLTEVNENEIGIVLDKIKNDEIFGINITLPYKKKIIPFLQEIVNDAKLTGSVNTVFKDKKNNLIGENSDVYGLQAGYLNKIINNEKRNQKALVLGAGGVSPSVIVSLKKSKIENIFLANRTYEKTLFLKKQFPYLQIIKWSEVKKSIGNFDIIVNATSLGLTNSQDFDFLFENYKKSLIYIDTIYNPKETKMIKHLKSNNVQTYNGLDMFIYQGQKSFYLWHKINPEIDGDLVELLVSKLK